MENTILKQVIAVPGNKIVTAVFASYQKDSERIIENLRTFKTSILFFGMYEENKTHFQYLEAIEIARDGSDAPVSNSSNFLGLEFNGEIDWINELVDWHDKNK